VKARLGGLGLSGPPAHMGSPSGPGDAGGIVDARRAPTVGLMTVGCKLNQYETEGLAELFEQRGFVVVPFESQADAYVVNTCTVTGRSDYRCRQMLRRAARRSPGALVAAVGCYAQRDAGALAEMPEVGIVVGNSGKPQLVDLVLNALRNGWDLDSPTLVVGEIAREDFHALDIERFRGYTRAFLKIQDGCDSRCAYCAVPDARGPSRSRPYADVIEQAKKLADAGYRELVLTGVHIGAYAAPGGARLARLLDGVSAVEGVERVRLGSIEPLQLTAELATVIVGNPAICRHLHIPLQSGSDRILERMRRGYSAADYARAVTRVADRVDRLGLGADVMVGFPGETASDFADTVSLVERLPFTYLHVFSFSPRAGTAAATMPDQVDGLEKKRRSETLRALGQQKSLAFRKSLVGKELDVLVLDQGDGGNDRLTALASEYVSVVFEGPRSLANRFVAVRVTGADEKTTRAATVPGSER